ncbi:hypothetical protein ASPBRDRAFT_44563 [Aspergillus brasiliensis CBS 101740]|uniref:Heterokaryon incompatibility domain-containing protein n=1 Tax=Aspergillus brasiliensis (strain CBS 101740 / IMI 381727 / IBT 21946) TaxID=767769 RepID=A0A1L9UFI7_ASPBC|nr:hypothetical protein ASPBRDRAFT_44563 [Aspergillus brasiliensis CBS 101740]
MLYERLDPAKNEVRLFKIWPDENEANPVQGSLYSVSLNDELEFEALSYVWGDITATADAWVNGHKIAVPTNLERFLRALRQPKEERVVWVDYFCINQEDMLEKNTQVPLMSQIYRNASSVIAWLGEPSPNIEEAIAYNDWTRGEHTPRSQFWHDTCDEITLSPEETRKRNLRKWRAYLGFCEIFHSPYWRRLWTFQEWIVPRKRPICMCGRISFIMGNIEDQLLKYWSFATKSLENLDDEEPEYAEAMRKLDKERLEKCDRTFLDLLPTDVFKYEAIRPNDGRLLGFTLGSLLIWTAHRKSSNSLDRVYALYALAPEVQVISPPDYHKPLAQFLHETTTHVLHKEKYLKVLEHFEFCQDPSLPSWVLDFVTTDTTRRRLLWNAYCRDAPPAKDLWDQDDSHSTAIGDDLRTLELWGRSVGCVCYSKAVASEGLHSLPHILSLSSCIRKDSQHPDPSGLADTVIRACYTYTKSSKVSTFALFTRFMEFSISLNETADGSAEAVNECIDLLKHHFSIMGGKRIFVICSGPGKPRSIGFTDCDIESGDCLFIASGLPLIFVLREMNGDTAIDESDSQFYKIVGRAFVEGIAEEEKEQPTPFVQEVRSHPLIQVNIR